MIRLFCYDETSDESDDENRVQRIRQRRPRLFKPRMNFTLPPSDNQSRFRLTDAHVDHVVERISPFIRHPTNRNFALSPEQQIRLSLRYLSTGDFFRTVGDAHGVHKSTLSRALYRFVRAVNRHLYPELVDWPNARAQAVGVVERFRDKAGMPFVFGCIDGSHIDLVNVPKAVEPNFVNRHQNHSLNAMFVCGPSLRYEKSLI